MSHLNINDNNGDMCGKIFFDAPLNNYNNEYGIRRTIIAEITKVKYNPPATIVFWSDGTKTVVKAENEEFDPEKGLAMAISKKVMGNGYNYYHTFRKYLPKVLNDGKGDI